MQCESSQRKLAEVMIGTPVEDELVPMTIPMSGGGEEIIPVPLVYIPNLKVKITSLLDQYKQ